MSGKDRDPWGRSISSDYHGIDPTLLRYEAPKAKAKNSCPCTDSYICSRHYYTTK